jgi:drug/metabolite transporter (DMT)-like permease
MIALGPARLRLDYLGIGAALLAAFSFSFYNIAGHGILGRYDHWIVLFYTTLSASLVWLVINPPWRIAAAHYSAAEWIFLLVFALLSVLVPFSFYFAGLGHLEPTRAIIVSCLEPVFSIVIAAFALGELLSPLQTVGIILVLAAIVLVQRPDRKSAALVVEPID